MIRFQSGRMASAALAVALGWALPAFAVETGDAAARTGAPEATDVRAADGAGNDRIAQFTLPGARPAPGGAAPAAPVPQVLPYEYVYGSELEVPYINNRDLNRKVHDRDLNMSPTVFGAITYRPTNWIDTRLEGTLSRTFGLKQEKITFLPGAEDEPVYRNDRRNPSLLIDQAYVRFKPPSLPFVELTVGRENFEDRRLWLYDASLDSVHLKFTAGDFHLDAIVGQENFKDLDLLQSLPKSTVTFSTLYLEYRGIEDHQIAAYSIRRQDSQNNPTMYSGRPHFSGVRAMGRPADSFNYWADLGFVRGGDENREKLQGYGYDVGGTYRFVGLPWQPSITLGYAFGSGDETPTGAPSSDRKNTQFRQTGIQSNEARFGGVTQFKRYGEFFDPELNNIKIHTVGVGFRPAGWFFVDLVYQHYRMAEYVPASGFTSASGVSAEVNVVDTPVQRLSKELGQEVDLILGFRNLFGIRGFGSEVRAGLFYPGRAYHIPDPNTGRFKNHPDKGISALFVFFF